MKLLIFIVVFLTANYVQANILEIGIYKMKVNFSQEETFIDYLIVEDSNFAVFTVPGSFTSTVEIKGKRKSFFFELKARERTRDILLNFKGNASNDGKAIAGVIIEPSTSSIIGKFKGVKLYESRQDCGDNSFSY